jgi:hypothetical protein
MKGYYRNATLPSPQPLFQTATYKYMFMRVAKGFGG